MEEAPEARDSRTRDTQRNRDHRPERQRDRDHGQEKLRDRDHGQERQRDRDHGQERQRDRDHGQERQRDRDHGQERQRDRDHGQERLRDRDHGQERQRDRDHGQERQRDRDHGQERLRDRDHGQERLRDRDHGQERQRDRDHGQERQRDRDHGQERQRDRDRRREREGDRPRDPDWDRRGDRDPDRRGDRDRDRRENRDWDRRGDRDGDRRSERDPRLDRQDWEHPRSNGQRVREKSRQSRTQDVFWEQPRDRAPPLWPAREETPDPCAQRKTGFGRSESDYPLGRSLTFSPRPELEEVEYYQSEAAGLLECHKCRYLCTGRACCQLMKVLLNLLILASSSVSYNSTGGYTGITSLGGIYYYQYGGAFSGFDGPDGEKAQQLDIQFYHLKLPTVTAAMAYGGGLMAFSCLLILLGVLRVPWHCPLWLVIEAILDVLIAGSYIPALYFYFHHLSDAYNSPVCKERETLYQSKGYSGFTCSYHGGDIGAGVFAAIGIIVFAVGAVLAFRAYRRIRKSEEKLTEAHEL